MYIKEKEEICNGDMHMSTERNLGALVRDTILNFRILVNLQGGGTEEAFSDWVCRKTFFGRGYNLNERR